MFPLDTFFAPATGIALLILRVSLGVIFIVHGWMKANPSGPMGGARGYGQMLGQMGMPGTFGLVVGYVHAWGEVIGGIMLIPGLLTRLGAVPFAIVMLLAIFMAKIPQGTPFMAGEGQGTGWEFDFINLATLLALLIMGSGSISLDRLLGLPL